MDRQVSRHEIKYSISLYTARLLMYRLPGLLRRDSHAGPDGGYFIRSIYFDDPDFTAYHEKLTGVKERTKYRLRFYNMDHRTVFLERKRKDGDLTGKDSVPLTGEQARALFRGRDMPPGDAGLLEEFLLLRKGGFRPAVVVDYQRYAYTYPVQDVRVTLDLDVRTCPYQTDGFSQRLLTVPALEPGEAVLEVKYDAFLPAPVRAVLEDVPKRREAVSKYVKCLSILE